MYIDENDYRIAIDEREQAIIRGIRKNGSALRL